MVSSPSHVVVLLCPVVTRRPTYFVTDQQSDLVTYCERENIPFTVFEDWSTILSTTRDIYEGKTTAQEVAALKSK